ncbi:glycosyltransferase [Dechloromonas sp. ZS-1]|uniref:glycosyltransferase family protein n=1 Tax=Dechloromonas sp. ZS-1 TaxID=3138067 RepID=UPI0031FBF38B
MSGKKVIINYRKGFEPLEEGFRNLGYEVIENAWTLPADPAQIELVIVNLYEAIRQPWRTWRFRQALKRAGIPLIGLDRDAPWHMGIRKRRIAWFRLLNRLDIYATHTMQPTWEFAPVKIYSPNAVWVRNFNLHGCSLAEMRDPDFYEYDVSFLGNMDGVRYKEHAARQAFFEALRPRLDALGIRHYIKHSSGISEAEQIRVIQRSRINLSFRSSCDHGGELSWGLPERCYGVPARGGFLLTDRRRHAADDFDVAREWADYDDMDDCIRQIQHWLAHFDQTRDIAEAAHAKVMACHTYEHRAQNLINAAQACRSAALGRS